MEPEQRGRASRASSTSSLGREVRCGCQYYQSDSLLPERRALLVRPSSRTMQQPPAVRCSEHEYELIAPPPPSLPHPMMAPVVRITDTDVIPVADSDDSIDRVVGRLPPELILDGDVVLPLDGKIEDSAMEGRELGETGGDTSEEQEPTAQQLSGRLEERFLDVPTAHTESRTDGEVNTSQIDSSKTEEIRHGARGLPQRLKTQAGKLRSRLRGFRRPAFTFPQRQKPEKITTRSTTSGSKTDKPRTAEKRPSRIDRIRISISEKSAKISLPDRSKFHLPERPKFNFPERPKFNFPERPKFNFPDKSKFTIKASNIRLPSAFARVKRSSSLREQQQRSTESTAGSKRNIFDFATYPRIFDRKSKKRGEYATSSPKDSRAQSAESATFSSTRKEKFFDARWTRPFEEPNYIQNQDQAVITRDDTPPWQTSMEEPRLSAKMEEEIMAAAHAIPWEDAKKRERHYDEEEIQYMDYEQESSQEVSDRHPPPRRSRKDTKRKEKSYEHEEAMDINTKLRDDQKTQCIRREEAEEENDWRVNQQIMLEEKIKPIPRSRSLDEEIPRALEQERYDSAFMAVDPRQFGQRKIMPEEEEDREQEEDEEEREPSSAHSDREQQPSSGSSYERRRRGIIEEIDSDEFFIRESGISEDNVNLDNYLINEIRNALRSEIVSGILNDDNEIPSTPPQRPARTRSPRKRKEDSSETNEVRPPTRPKRERIAARRSREASIVDEVFRERTRSDSRSDSRHRIVYQTESENHLQKQEPLDDIVVVKPVRRKSRSSLRSQSQPPMETFTLPSSMSATHVMLADSSSIPLLPPTVPIRRKRSHRETVIDNQRNGDVVICNGRHEWQVETVISKKPMAPVRSSRSRQSLQSEQLVIEDDVIVASASREAIEKLEAQIQKKNVSEPTPVPPKRRSRSRTTSVAADEDRTSHGAESLPDIGYAEEEIPRDETDSIRDLFGYAIVEKREKPPRPPLPRRKRNKFATTPRPIPPKRPQRAYSTLGPPATRSRPDTSMSDTVASETISRAITCLTPTQSISYVDSDDDGEHRMHRSGKVLNKIQGRPLPAPPRPPRMRKEHAIIERPRTPFEFAMTETTTATQTDPLPDDVVIEEEITQAKLIVSPSRSGSQVTVSMERIPSPSRMSTPPVPPLPISQFLQKKEEKNKEEEQEDEDIGMTYETRSLTPPSPTREADLENRHMSAPHLERENMEESRLRQIRSALLSDEPLRISSLEVGDLKVDRLSVSQIEAHKIVASEVDAMVIAASELRGGSSVEESLSPAIIKELIAIRSHLETVATSQTREKSRENEKESTDHKITDIPTSRDDSQVQERLFKEEEFKEANSTSELTPKKDDKKLETDEDQKVVKTDVLDVTDKISHTFSVAQTGESTSLETLAINQLESNAKDESTKHLLTVAVQDIQDKSLQILDSEHPLILKTTSDSHVDESCASFPSSSGLPATPVHAYECVDESPNSSVQTTISTTTTTATTATESTATSTTGLRGSKDDLSDSKEQTPRKSRSRSSSPVKGIVRQTASPVRSLPPVISVTPDTPDSIPGHSISTDAQPQRAVISYSSDTEYSVPSKEAARPQRAIISHSSDTGRSLRERQRESSQSPTPSFPLNTTHFIAFPASEIPIQFFSPSETPTSQQTDSEPGVIDTTQQLLRALRSAGIKAMKHFVRYLTSTISTDDTREKVREIELAICALLIFIAGLLIYYFTSSHNVTHYHHWDYFNPPK